MSPRLGSSGVGSVPRSRRHHGHGEAPRPIGCAVITISDTRGPREDRSGDRIQRLVERAGHAVVSRAWVRDEAAPLRRATRAVLRDPRVDVVITTGGTGVAPRDRTPDALGPLVQRWLPGFGERFRSESVAQIGTAAWLSRSAAGIARGKLLVMLPGSTGAVELAMRRVLLPELVHVVRLIGRFGQED